MVVLAVSGFRRRPQGELSGFFPGKHLIQFLVLKIKDFRNFVLDNCILVFDAEQVYLKVQVINLKN